MKHVHASAIACFAVAFVFYLLSWIPGAFALVILGVAFEIAAWAQMVRPARVDKNK